MESAPMLSGHCLLLALLSLVFFYTSFVEGLDGNQVKGLLGLQKLLERPSATANWFNNTNFCSLPPSPSLNISCSGENLTYLRIVGNKSRSAYIMEKPNHGSGGGSVGNNRSLSSSFSVNTLVDTLLTFPELRGIELVSMGMWGHLPDKLGQLKNLQVLNMSSNLFTGAIPRSLSNLAALKTLALDNNALNGSFPYWLSTVPTIETVTLSNNRLSGDFNDTISYFWNLKILSLSNNLFEGSLPGSMTSLQNLVLLSLAHNHFAGPIPNLDNLVNLQNLNLGGNKFGPDFPLLGSQLVSVHMGQNHLTGPVPSFFKDFLVLQALDLSANALTGTPPDFLFGLPNISSMSLARNHFTGTLPVNISLSNSLYFLDVSNNFFSGVPPLVFLNPKNVTLHFQNNCMATNQQKQQTTDGCIAAEARLGILKLNNRRRIVIIAAAVGGGLGLALAVSVLIIVLCTRRGSEKSSVAAPEDLHHSFASTNGVPSELLFNARYISQSKRLGLLPAPQNRTFTIEELKVATNNFGPLSFVGEGRHGKVFKGQLEDKTKVAVKWVAFKSKEDMNEFKTQVDMLGRIRHRHLVSVLGHCTEEMSTTITAGDGTEEQKSFCLFIVSEFVEHGDLRSHVGKKESKDGLNWSQRLAAVIGAGRGIHYLHTGVVPPIFYNNLKITNILLDENMVAQVSDFGLPVRRVSFSMDTIGADPRPGGNRHAYEESLRRKENRDKQDVYDYGAILLEIVLGRPPTIKNPFPQKRSELERLTKEKGPSMELIDRQIVGMCGAESLATVLEIAGKCMIDDPLRRPSMEDVLWNLQYAAQVHTSVDDGPDENDLRREEFQKAPGSGELKKRGYLHDNRVSDEDWKAGPSSSQDFLR